MSRLPSVLGTRVRGTAAAQGASVNAETEWDAYEDEGFLDLEDHLELALERAFPTPTGRVSMTEDLRIKSCSSCDAPIIWLLTKHLKHIPVDAATVKPGETQYTPPGHISHFATCPNANQHRKKRG
jgi:hypothetical protein